MSNQQTIRQLLQFFKKLADPLNTNSDITFLSVMFFKNHLCSLQADGACKEYSIILFTIFLSIGSRE